MKKLFLLSLLSFWAMWAKAQTVHAINTTTCAVDETYVAIDPVTCAVVSSAGTFTIPAGTVPPGIPITLSWSPLPAAPFFFVAEVSRICPGAPFVRVGGPGPCGLNSGGAPLPPACGCPLGHIDMPALPPIGPVPPPGMIIPVDVHP